MHSYDALKHALFNHNPCICMEIELETNRITDVNNAAITDYGYTREEWLCLTPIDLLPERENASPIFIDALKRLGDGENMMLQTRHRRKDGEMLYLVLHLTKFFKNGKACLICVGQNLTSYKMLEELWFKQNQLLQTMNDGLDEKLQMAFHDLRGPLTSARGLLNVLHGKNKDKALNPFLDLMDESLMKMDERIDDVLEKANETFHSTATERINLKSLLESILDDISFMNNYPKISISRKFLNNVPFVSNEQLLRTVLENLITNAIKYHNVDQANPMINITCMTTTNECAIEIVDNGLGMDTAYIENIFSKFYRIDATQAPGNGVGLHLVKESIDKLNGKISVMSRKGVGSNFLIRIPNLFETKSERTTSQLKEALTA